MKSGYMMGVVNFDPFDKTAKFADFLDRALDQYRQRYPSNERLAITIRPEFLSLLMLETPGRVKRSQTGELLFDDCVVQVTTWAYGVTAYIHPEGAHLIDLTEHRKERDALELA